MVSQTWHLICSQVASVHPQQGVKTGFPCPSHRLTSRRHPGTGSRCGTCEWAVRSSSQRVHKPVAWDYSPNPCPVEAADPPERSHPGNKVRPHASFSQSPVPGTGFSQPAGQQLRELEKLGRKTARKEVGRKGEQRQGEPCQGQLQTLREGHHVTSLCMRPTPAPAATIACRWHSSPGATNEVTTSTSQNLPFQSAPSQNTLICPPLPAFPHLAPT